jgi:DHA2 family methylenomycin A resistance protein-like MFS transporter
MHLLSPPANPAKWMTLWAACLGLSMLMVNTFVVTVALPAMARDLDVDLGTAQWIVSGFVLTLGVLPVAAGRLADILGRREVYIVGLVAFLAASLGCALATDIYTLLFFRVMQGVGAAIMQPVTLSIVINAFPAHERGLAVGVWSGVSGLGLILGPLLGGLLVIGDNWRPVFLINMPVGLLALVMALRYVPQSLDESASRAIDWPGVALLSGGLFLIMFGVTRGNGEGWASTLILACFLAGGAAISFFVLIESRMEAPLVDLSLFRSGTFVMACLSASLFSATVFGSQPYTSLFMQNLWGMSPLEAGLAFLPATVLVVLLMPFSGVLSQRLGRHLRLVVIAGSISVAFSFAYLLRLGVDDRYLDGFLPAFILRGIGIGLVMTATSLAVVSAVPLAKSGLASGTLTMARNVGTSMGVAILGAAYLRYIDFEASRRFPGIAGEQSPFLVIAARRFIPSTDAALRGVSEQLIVDGYVLVAGVGLVMVLIATAAAIFIRHGATAARPAPTAAANPAPAGAALHPES